jgi:MFS family permease
MLSKDHGEKAVNKTDWSPIPGQLGLPLRRAVSRLRGKISLQKTFTALRYPNYRLWFWGQLVSLLGTWMQMTAQSFLVFELTHSPAYLGYVGFVSGVPSWLFMLYGGVIADRVSRRTLLLITQTSMMVLAFILAALTFLHLVKPEHIILLAFGLGIANAFDAPARHAFVSELVDREDMGNAIALNATMFQSGTAIGPAVAGLTYAAFGPSWCFIINGISFIAVIAALLAMRMNKQIAAPRHNSGIADLKEGLRYVISQPIISSLIAIVAVISLFGISFVTLIPAWAVNMLGGDAKTNGLLQSARGAGALVAALLIASLGRFQFKGKLLTFGTFALPTFLIAFAVVHWLPLSLIALVGVGFGTVLSLNMTNVLTQSLVPDSLRGRVMSIYSLTFFGLVPIGFLLVGMAAEHFSEPLTVMACGIISIASSLAVWISVPRLSAMQ